MRVATNMEDMVGFRRSATEISPDYPVVVSKFVEDAARVVYEQFDGDARVRDFVIACSHLESLHSHDAVSVINKGMPSGLSADFSNFRDLIC